MKNNPLDIKEVQQVALKLLTEFDKICRDLDLNYSLGGGTLLGAVRHKGFIPWDDDVDVMMPRPDYEKFKSYCLENEVSFDLFTLDNIVDYKDLFIKLGDRKTLAVSELSPSKDKSIGVWIDVFPIDGLANTKQEAKKVFRETIFKRELLVASKWKKYFRSQSKSIIYEPIRLGLFLLSRFFDGHKLAVDLDRIYQTRKIDSCDYSACICGAYREKEIMPTDVFMNIITLDFEGENFKVISKFDDYLKEHYGDYMKIPSEANRVSNHQVEFYWKE